MKVRIFPDNFAFYRAPVFVEIGRLENVQLEVFAPTRGRARGRVKAAAEGVDYLRSQLNVSQNRNFIVGEHIIWTTGLVSSVIFRGADVIICWGEVQNVSVWVACFFGKLLRRNVFLWTHGIYGRESVLKRLLRLALYRGAAGLMLYGRYAQRLLVDAGIAERKIWVVRNSFRYAEQKMVRERLDPREIIMLRRSFLGSNSARGRVLLFVGRIKRSRKLEVLLHALRALQSKRITTTLVVIGDGDDEYRENCVRLASELDLSASVIFRPGVYEEVELGKIFLAADLAVCPDGVGLFAIHSHGYGLPVCTHDDMRYQKPEVEVIEEGSTGFFFRRNDPGDLAEKISGWFAVPRSREEVSKACVARVEGLYNPYSQATVFGEIFETLGKS